MKWDREKFAITALGILFVTFLVVILIGRVLKSRQTNPFEDDDDSSTEETSDYAHLQDDIRKEEETLQNKLKMVNKEMDDLKKAEEEGGELSNEKKKELTIELEKLAKEEVILEEEEEELLQRIVNATNPPMDLRLKFIKMMTKSAWNAYTKYAWPNDFLKPLSNTSNLSYFGLNSGQTILASLSTLWIMNLEEEFNQGKAWIVDQFDFSKANQSTSLFKRETEYLGGLLSCYALTGEDIFLVKAKQVASSLEDAYEDKLSSGNFDIYFAGQYLENVYLSKLTDNLQLKFRSASMKRVLESALNFGPKSWQISVSSVFAPQSIYYQTLLKAALQSNASDLFSKYNLELKEIIEKQKLIETTTKTSNETVWARNYNHTEESFGKSMEYTGCYLGAMLALGAKTMKSRIFSNEDEKNATLAEANRQEELAVKLTETCHEASTKTATKLGPRIFYPEENFKVEDSSYDLSPELAESYFILWRLTHNPKYRNYAWQMAKAINQFCRTANGGFSGISDFSSNGTILTDSQNPIFLSATLKYLYLTFTEDTTLPLDQWIFNLVGHPLPICGKQNAYPAELCDK